METPPELNGSDGTHGAPSEFFGPDSPPGDGAGLLAPGGMTPGGRPGEAIRVWAINWPATPSKTAAQKQIRRLICARRTGALMKLDVFICCVVLVGQQTPAPETVEYRQLLLLSVLFHQHPVDADLQQFQIAE